MFSFSFVDGTPEQFVQRVRSALIEHDFDDIVAVAFTGTELVVTFSKLGTTTLRYQIETRPGGFLAQLASSRVAAFHAPFQKGFEQKFQEVIAHVGASVET